MYSTFKDKLVQYGVFFGLVLFLFLMTAGIAVLVGGRWTSSLRTDVQKVLDAVYPGSCIVKEQIKIKIPASVSAAAYTISAQAKDGTAAAHDESAIILRITGFSGPVPVVFIYNNVSGARFAGIAGLKKTAVNHDRYGISQPLLDHWMLFINTVLAGDSHEKR